MLASHSTPSSPGSERRIVSVQKFGLRLMSALRTGRVDKCDPVLPLFSHIRPDVNPGAFSIRTESSSTVTNCERAMFTLSWLSQPFNAGFARSYSNVIRAGVFNRRFLRSRYVLSRSSVALGSYSFQKTPYQSHRVVLLSFSSLAAAAFSKSIVQRQCLVRLELGAQC